MKKKFSLLLIFAIMLAMGCSDLDKVSRTSPVLLSDNNSATDNSTNDDTTPPATSIADAGIWDEATWDDSVWDQ